MNINCVPTNNNKYEMTIKCKYYYSYKNLLNIGRRRYLTPEFCYHKLTFSHVYYRRM